MMSRERLSSVAAASRAPPCGPTHAAVRGDAIGQVLGLDDEPRPAVAGRGGAPRAALRPHPRGAVRTHLEQAPLAPLVALASRGDRAAEPFGLACDALVQARLRGC